MRRLLAIVPALLGLAAPTGAHASLALAPPSLAVKLVSCEVGALEAQRAAEFSGAMPALAGASVLAMRFDLEQRRSGSWKRVLAPAFGRYERSGAGAAGFVYVKRVQRLAPGASYRVTVRFKWVGKDGAVRKRAVRHSAACRQPDLRPDLAVTAVRAEPGPAGRTRYVVQLRNRGLGAVVGTLRVGLAVDGTALPDAALAGLGAGEEGTVTFDGPACPPGGALTASADPGNGIEEPRKDDDRLVVPCG